MLLTKQSEFAQETQAYLCIKADAICQQSTPLTAANIAAALCGFWEMCGAAANKRTAGNSAPLCWTPYRSAVCLHICLEAALADFPGRHALSIVTWLLKQWCLL